MRHFRVTVKHPILSFLRFGKIQIHLHVADATVLISWPVPNAVVFFNCDYTGHLANRQRPVSCNLCKSVHQKAKNCPHSWVRETVHADQQEEPKIATPLVDDHIEFQVENEVELSCDEVLPELHESSQS